VATLLVAVLSHSETAITTRYCNWQQEKETFQRTTINWQQQPQKSSVISTCAAFDVIKQKNRNISITINPQSGNSNSKQHTIAAVMAWSCMASPSAVSLLQAVTATHIANLQRTKFNNQQEVAATPIAKSMGSEAMMQPATTLTATASVNKATITQWLNSTLASVELLTELCWPCNRISSGDSWPLNFSSQEAMIK